jgi:hypothetical protein
VSDVLYQLYSISSCSVNSGSISIARVAKLAVPKRPASPIQIDFGFTE